MVFHHGDQTGAGPSGENDDMKILVDRICSRADFTLCAVYVLTRADNARRFVCFGLEDEQRTVKVFGETRIPAGEYEVKFRKEGGHHARYAAKFPFHLGMLHITDVPNFKWILIHIGNDDDDTAGCLLVGETADAKKGFVGRSTDAYKAFYPQVANALAAGEHVTIRYTDIA